MLHCCIVLCYTVHRFLNQQHTRCTGFTKARWIWRGCWCNRKTCYITIRIQILWHSTLNQYIIYWINFLLSQQNFVIIIYHITLLKYIYSYKKSSKLNQIAHLTNLMMIASFLGSLDLSPTVGWLDLTPTAGCPGWLDLLSQW